MKGSERLTPVPAKAIGSGRRDGSPVGRGIGEIGFVLAVTLVGGWLRFSALGRDGLWLDEVVSAQQAHLPFWDLLRAVRRDTHPPLFHLLLHGTLTLGDSEAVLRIPSAFFGTLSIPLLYILGRDWFSGCVGALAALLLAISPFHLWHSQDARMYSLLTFEGMVSWYLFARLLTVSRASLWVGYVLASEAMLYTHYSSLLLLFAQSGMVALLRSRGETDGSFSSRWLRAQVGLVLLLVPWLLFAGRTFNFKGLLWIEAFHPLSELGWTLVGLTSGYRGHYWEAIGLPPVPRGHIWIQAVLVLGLAVVGVVRDDSGYWRTPRTALRKRPILLCLWYFMAPIVMVLSISLLQPLLVPRYLLMTAPAFFVLVALGLSRLFPKRMIIAGAALIVLLFAPGLTMRLSTPRTADYRGVTALIASQATPGDGLLASELHARRTVAYYLRSRESEFKWCPRSLRDTSSEATQTCLAGVRRVWAVSGEEAGGSGQADIHAALETQFEAVRSASLFRVRVSLYMRR